MEELLCSLLSGDNRKHVNSFLIPKFTETHPRKQSKPSVDCMDKTISLIFLDFVQRLNYKRITTFRKLDLLPSSGKKGREQKPYLLGPLVELASDLDNYNTEVPGIKKNCGQ
jgi:hypothetical protein